MPFMSCTKHVSQLSGDRLWQGLEKHCAELTYQVQVVKLQRVWIGLGGVDRHLRAVYVLWRLLYAVLDDQRVPARSAANKSL